MTKLLIWGLVLYFVYRWVQKNIALAERNTRHDYFDQQNNDPIDEGEYIDYEEIK